MRITFYPNYNNYSYNRTSYKQNFQAKKVTDIPKEVLEKLIAKDYSIKMIAEELGVQYHEVYPNLKKHKLQTTEMREYEILKENIVDHLTRGETTTEILAQYEINDRHKIYQAAETVLGKKYYQEFKLQGQQNRKERELKGSNSQFFNKKDYYQTRSNQAFELVKQGTSVNVAVKEVKISVNAFYNHINKEEVIKAQNQIKKKDFEIIKSLFQKGYDIKDINKEQKYSIHKIKGLINANNYQKQYLIDRDKARANIIEEYRQLGFSDKDIAQKFGITENSVKRIYEKYKSSENK